MVSRFDHQLGLIQEKLQETGFYDDTHLIVFSDHGDYTGDYTITEKVQNCFEDPISNVPLLIKPAKSIQSVPRITKAQAELVDLPATIAELAEIELSYTQFGRSLVHVLTGDEEHKDAVFVKVEESMVKPKQWNSVTDLNLLTGRVWQHNTAKVPNIPKQLCAKWANTNTSCVCMKRMNCTI